MIRCTLVVSAVSTHVRIISKKETFRAELEGAMPLDFCCLGCDDAFLKDKKVRNYFAINVRNCELPKITM